ncbi:breast cancer type 2 susceptibility protein [Aulostomus maculatus]
MESSSESMFDTLKDAIWKELGPLNPDWFDVLSAQAVINQAAGSDQDDICANQEGHFKTPFDKTSVESQLFSTPKVFRHSRVVSPETEDEQSFAAEKDLFHIPQKSPISYTKHISESLGAQHLDISWTSSLNTPPPLASTLILSKTDASPSPVTLTNDQSVQFVRKLFPSLSNASNIGPVSPKSKDLLKVQEDADFYEADQNPPESPSSPQGSLNPRDRIWRQKLTDAIEDGDDGSTVASVPDEAENALSPFFSNSSSALRKVKTERIKRKQIIINKDPGCGSPDILTENKAASAEQGEADQDLCRVLSSSQQKSPGETGDIGMTQWSPFSLSEISTTSVDSSCPNNPDAHVENKELQKDSSSAAQLVKHSSDSGFVKKKRTFVYTVETSKPKVLEKERHSQRMDSLQEHKLDVELFPKGQNVAEYCSKLLDGKNVQKREHMTEENLPPPVQAKVQDFDMSQLCKAFAQDFSQTSNPDKVCKTEADTPQKSFSPSACLTALKQAKHKARQAGLLSSHEEVRHQISATTLNNSIIEGTISDSGFHSAVADITHVTASSATLPILGKQCQTQQLITSDSTKKENGIDHLEDISLGAMFSSGLQEKHTLTPDRECEHSRNPSTQLSSSAKAPIDNSAPCTAQAHGSLPQKTSASLPHVPASGFKTASNKGIKILTANLEKAKRLFEETESESLLSDQFTKWSHDTKDDVSLNPRSVNNSASASNHPPLSSDKVSDSQLHLTASQKADVTELCTLLEGADSQFEFTQFKTANQCQDSDSSLQKADKEFDPELLSGIDFDDSFCSVTEKSGMYGKITSVSAGNTNMDTKSTDVSFPSEMKKDLSHGHASCSSECVSEGAGFKKAGGNVGVLKQGLSKASAVLQKPTTDASGKQSGDNDAEPKPNDGVDNNTRTPLHHEEEDSKVASFSPKHFSYMKDFSTDRRVTDMRDENAPKHFESSKMDITTCQSGFQMANGKGISISAKAIREANAIFKDCELEDRNDFMPIKQRSNIESINGTYREDDSKCKSTYGIKVNLSEESVRRHTELENAKVTNVAATAKPFSSPSCTSSKVIGSADVLCNGVGFSTASGKKVSVSADALTKAARLLNEVDAPEDTKRARTGHQQTNLSGGFQTAGGKRVSVSTEAIKMAKLLLSECDEFMDPANLNSKSSKTPLKDPPPQNTGFLTSSEKPVAFSAEAPLKAKALFNDITVSSQTPEVSCTRKCGRTQDNAENTVTMSCGFTTAGGATVRVSQKNLLKAKKLLKDLDGSFSAQVMEEADDFFGGPDIMDCNDQSVKYEKTGESIKQKKNILQFNNTQQEKAHISVDSENMSAGGVVFHEKKLHDSDLENHNGVFKNTLALTKAPSMHANSSVMTEPPSSSSYTVQNNTGSSLVDLKNGFSKASRKSSSVKDDAITETVSLLNESLTFEDTDKQPTSNNTKDTPLNCGFQTASGRGVVISAASLKRAKSLLSECDEVEDETTEKMLPPDDVEINRKHCANTPDVSNTVTLRALPSPLCISSENIGFSSMGEFTIGGGFSTASGKKVSVSDDAVAKAKCLLDEGVTSEDSCKQLKQKKDDFPPPNVGFQTASGKGVAISSAALKKAKSLLSDDAEVEDPTGTKPIYSSTVQGPPGFRGASGRPLVFSSEAIQKAKALFDDIGFSEEIPAVLGRKSDKKPVTSPTTTRNTDVSKNKDVPRTLNVNKVGHKTEPSEECAPQSHLSSWEESSFVKERLPSDAFKFKEGDVGPPVVGYLHGERIPSMLDCEIDQTRHSKTPEFPRTENSSVVNLKSLNLTGCSETQQRLHAQEALDCTKALLEDESVAGVSMTLENMPPQEKTKSTNRPVEEQKPTGKRLAEDTDMTTQPPLKRRLLDEFDRTLDSSGGPGLHPERSSPNGIMKDRRVFKYSVSLQPNVTLPHRNGKNYVEARLQKATQHSTPGDSRLSQSKAPSFVPPFFKNTKINTPKNNAVKDNARTPSTFVPPFKRQRTSVQECCSKPHKDEDKHQSVTVAPFNSNTFVPPTKKRKSSLDLSGNKSREDIQKVALAEPTDNENHPVGYASEDCTAEASGVGDMLNRSQETMQSLHNIELARDMQAMRIRKKQRQTIRPLPGSLFLTKTSGVTRIPLKDAVNGKPPARYTAKQLYEYGVHQHVSEITSETAESFRFPLKLFLKKDAFKDEGGVQLADGGWLIPSNDGTAGKKEFYRALCDTPGVDPKLISEEWAYNHYRWIVWKQASMEISFPGTMGSLLLTPEQVLLQLKYRYDVEVDCSRRPALRRIMEKDDTAVKTLVLCVCGVVSRGHSPAKNSHSDVKTPQGAKVESPCAVVWLTDGWYAIKTQLDDPLTAMLHKGRLAVGGKLIIHGAQLVGSQEACSPLEAPESLMLKICANSSRLSRWDTKLGFYKDPRPFLLPLSCLYSNGGPVGCVDMLILRNYPIQWMEKKSDGAVVFRSVRAEEKEARRYNSLKQKAMEILFAKIQAEFEKEEKDNKTLQRRRQTVSRQDLARLQDGEELYEVVGDDPAYLEAHLSEQQLESLRSYKQALMERKQAELQDRYRRALENSDENQGNCPNRDVTPVWRLCFADSVHQTGIVYQLNIWRPSSDLQSLLKEGCRYKVYNLTASEEKKRSSTATVQFTATKKTQFQNLQTSQEWLSASFQPRISANFVDLQNSEFQPLCGEVDLVGYVITVVDGQGPSPAFYLVDGKLDFVKVRCFSSFVQAGLADVVKPRVLLALSNLQLRGHSQYPTPVVYAGDLTVFSTNPKETHLQDSLSQLRNLVQGQENFFPTADEKLSCFIKSDGRSSIASPALQPRTPASSTAAQQDIKTSKCQQSIRSHGSFTPVSRNPPPANSSSEKDPRTLKRRRALDYLCRIPSPPPLSHLGSVASLCVHKTFNPPRRSGTPSTLKAAQTPNQKPVLSPVVDEWVNDEELAMIDTQALHVGESL